MHIVVHSQIDEINAEQWNAMLHSNNPFMRHEFLNGLEQSECVCESTGWKPSHIAIYEDSNHANLIAAMPCYIKDHSYGEYIFDWAWADAHHRNGINYYPKLCNAVPFTPASGERWLINDSTNEENLSKILLDKAVEITKENNLSSFHSLFLNKEQFDQLDGSQILKRHSSQFHWQNHAYSNFDDFLKRMSSKKRKNIKRERRRIRESEISYRWLTGDELDESAVTKMVGFYQRTISYYGAQSYLNKHFFNYLAEHFNQHTLFLFAEYQGETIAGGLYFKSDDTLYGRYWGALANFNSVHFETCYYQAIEWCINNGYQRFEAGAQGEHKLARGLEPTTTYSAHWIRNPQFREAIGDLLKQESNHVEHYTKAMHSHSPFRTEL